MRRTSESYVPQEVTSEVADVADSSYEQDDNREVSPTAARLKRAADRVGSFLEKRVVNKAHAEAIAEDSARTEEYLESIESTVNLTPEDSMETTSIVPEVDRNAERKEAVKNFFGNIGNKSLSYLRQAGEITVSVTVSAGNVVGRGVKSATDSVALNTLYAADRVKSTITSAAETASLNALYGADRIKDFAQTSRDALTDKVDSAANFVTDKVDSIYNTVADKKDATINFVRDKYDAAVARKNARVARLQEARAFESAQLETIRAENQARADADREARIAELAEKAEAQRQSTIEKAILSRERKQARREKVASIQNKAGELWQTANTKRRAIGSKALSFVARTRATVNAATAAASSTWKQHAQQEQL
ncbi:MAG: hypothetical protein ABIQ04_03055 [Candidatus Saccharimonadales bacterium]